MNKTVFYAVKEWVRGLIGKVERRIKAVEKDVQKINKKLPNFLTRNYTTDKPINLVSQATHKETWQEWKFLDEPSFLEDQTQYYFSGNILFDTYELPVDVLTVQKDSGTGNYLFVIYGDNLMVLYATGPTPEFGLEITGWGVYGYGMLSTPPTLKLVSWEDDALVNTFLPANATFEGEETETIIDYEAELYTNGRGIFLESTRGEDGEQSQIGVGPWGVRMIAYGNRVLEFGNNGNRVTGLDAPTEDTDAANKAYVDEHAGGVPTITVTIDQVISESPVTFQLTQEQIAILDGNNAGQIVFDARGLESARIIFNRMDFADVPGCLYTSVNSDGTALYGIAYYYDAENGQLVNVFPQVTIVDTAALETRLTLDSGKFYQNGEDVTAQVKAALGIS